MVAILEITSTPIQPNHGLPDPKRLLICTSQSQSMRMHATQVYCLFNFSCSYVYMQYFVLGHYCIIMRNETEFNTKHLQLTMWHYDIHNSHTTALSCKVQWSATTLNGDQIKSRDSSKLHITPYNQFALQSCVVYVPYLTEETPRHLFLKTGFVETNKFQ